MKRAVIVHGWGGNNQEAWIPWLKEKLQEKGYQVETPAMPNTDEPHIKPWINYLSTTVGKPDEELSLVGHSIGCQTILRYLETLNDDEKIGEAVLVAPWFGLDNLEEEEKEIAKPWIETPIDFEKIQSKITKISAILSDDDPFVPLEDTKDILIGKLGVSPLILHKKGHMSAETGIKELPEILNFFKS
jgi:uncharacterized protein